MQIYLRMKIKSTADFHAGQYHITSATIIALSPTNSVSLKVGEGGGTERFPELSKSRLLFRALCMQSR